MKAVVYSATRNMYFDMVYASKSLIKNSDVDKVFFLVDDYVFPFETHPKIEIVNVCDQKWFKMGSPNYNSYWSHMVLLRAAYPYLFKDLDMILSLDNDTIVNGDVSDLWDIDMSKHYIAGVKESQRKDKNYINMGVSLFNLAKMRKDGIADKAIEMLNTKRYRFVEQDVFNELCKGKIKYIDAKYNSCLYTKVVKEPKITHYTGNLKGFKEDIKKYKELHFSDL